MGESGEIKESDNSEESKESKELPEIKESVVKPSDNSASTNPPVQVKDSKRVYSVNHLRQLKVKGKNASLPFYSYRIIQIYQTSRSSTPVAFQTRETVGMSNRHFSSRSASPMIFYTAGERLSNSRSSTPAQRRSIDLSNEDTSHPKNPEELMDYYHDDPSTLPKGDLLGRIQWMHQNNGRIRAIGKILSSRDLFFHFKDVELKDNQVLNVGDRVLFEISIYKNLVCATHIRKVDNGRSKSALNTTLP